MFFEAYFTQPDPPTLGRAASASGPKGDRCGLGGSSMNAPISDYDLGASPAKAVIDYQLENHRRSKGKC